MSGPHRSLNRGSGAAQDRSRFAANSAKPERAETEHRRHKGEILVSIPLSQDRRCGEMADATDLKSVKQSE